MDTNSRTTNAPLSSGVIEMRRLAAAHAAPGRTSVPTLELVLGVGSPTSGLGSPLAVRIERRAPQARRLAAVALSLVLSFAGGALVMGAGLRAAERRAPLPAASPSAPAPEPAAEPVEPEMVAPPPALVVPVEPSEPAPLEPAPVRTRRPRAVPTSPTSPASSPTDAPEARPSLDELLDRAASAGPAPSGPSSSPPLRRSPTRDEVRAAMSAIAPAVAACAEGQHGLANVTVTVAGETGRARSALVNGDFAGTAAGSCMARALRTIELPPFAQETFTVQYPFAI